MNGFDYVKEMRVLKNGTQWCKVWNSGYVEQGGFVENNGNNLIDVKFMTKYNYPSGVKFY